IAPGVVHGFSNPGPDQVRMRVDVTPALQMEEMLREIVALAEAGRLTRRGMPRNLVELARIACTYDNVARAPLVSVRLQRALLAPLTLASRNSRAARAELRPPRSALPADHSASPEGACS